MKPRFLIVLVGVVVIGAPFAVGVLITVISMSEAFREPGSQGLHEPAFLPNPSATR